MAKVKFTTNLEEDLLKEAKIKAIEKGFNVNDILENLLENYLYGEEKKMEMSLNNYNNYHRKEFNELLKAEKIENTENLEVAKMDTLGYKGAILKTMFENEDYYYQLTLFASTSNIEDSKIRTVNIIKKLVENIINNTLDVNKQCDSFLHEVLRVERENKKNGDEEIIYEEEDWPIYKNKIEKDL